MQRKWIKITAMVALVAVVMCVPLFVGSTYATSENQLTFTGAQFALYQKNTDSNTQNEILDGSSEPIFYSNVWEPGYSVIEYFTLDCDTDEAFTYSFQMRPAQGELTALARVIDVYYLETDSVIPGDREQVLGQMTCLGTLDKVLEDETLFTATGSGEAGFAVALKMRCDAGNIYQGMSLYEKDSQAQCFSVVLNASVIP